jgi:hypothetical protein
LADKAPVMDSAELKKTLDFRVHQICKCARDKASDVTPSMSPREVYNMYVGYYSTSNMSGDTPDSILDMVLSEVANATETCYINAIEIGYMH